MTPGNFAVYPQEYADGENLCTQSVTQGSPDVESPHAGATGGNVGITSCDPENKRRFRVSQTLGDLSLIRSFLRYDTGRFADNKLKMFFSFSHTEADKWKGEGRAKKDHFDAAFRWDLSEDNKVLGSVLYNRAINNNIATLSLAQIASRGYFADFGTHVPGPPACRQRYAPGREHDRAEPAVLQAVPESVRETRLPHFRVLSSWPMRPT
jgi:iron complex outermembrane receptor protein